MTEGAGERKHCLGWPDLAAVRQSRGITLDAIAQTTKISKRFLEAIEVGEFAKLPGGIFNTSYIRQYARAIEYDEIELVERYRLLIREYEPSVNASCASNKTASRWLTLLELS